MKKGKLSLNLFYMILWGIPIFMFARDFFKLKDLAEIFNESTYKTVAFSFKQASISVLLSFILSIVPAYYIAYRRDRISRLLESLIFIPFFFPVISTIVAFSIIFNLGFFKEFQVLYSFKAIIIANVFYNAPIFLKYLGEGMRSIPKEILEAARLEGIGEKDLFFKIKLPLIMPQIFRAFFMVFVYCFTSFAIILSLGGINYSTLEVEIATTLMGSFDFSRAFALGMVQFGVLTIVNSLGQRIEGYELKGEGDVKEVSFFTKIYSIIYLICEYAVVLTGLVFAFFNFYTGEISFEAFSTLFSVELNQYYPVVKGLINSLFLSGLVSALTLIFTYLILENYTKFTNYIIFSTFGFSSAFLAITLVYMNISWNIPLWVLLVIGYFLTSIPVAYSFMYQYIREFPKDILEAAKIDGAGKREIFFLIEFPILKNIFISIFLQIFAIVFGEFTITYTMQVGDIFPVVSLVNYSLASDKKFLESSALSAFNLIIIISLFILSQYLRDRDWKNS
ncbi:ABC transporter permease subunit [uncultured Ilyobacter sp.]|uniref:ABC transporter permease n=1 Tax=uncultured Ilyobacter sp. TaxID=544433 RepID=UPI002AA85331|nr:ABC transporter permease subunit [uncultured Ilyobacter sp.]